MEYSLLMGYSPPHGREEQGVTPQSRLTAANEGESTLLILGVRTLSQAGSEIKTFLVFLSRLPLLQKQQ
jgi:hypothetical protein